MFPLTPNTRHPTLLLLALCLCVCAAIPARSQIVYTLPQTNTQTAFSAVACSAAPLTFAVKNIGQTTHVVVYTTTGPPTSLQIQIIGNAVNNVSTAIPISAVATNVSSGAVSANIYLDFVWVQLLSCGGTGTITATYVASTVPPSPPTGIFNTSGIFQQTLAVGAAANSTPTYTFNPPNGATGGAITFQCSTCPNSWTLAPVLRVSAGPDANHLFIIANFSIQNLIPSGATQLFNIPNFAASVIRVNYIPGDSTTAKYDLMYSFGGSPPINLGPPSSPPQTLYKCNQEAAFTISSSGASTMLLVNGSAGNIHVCHIDFVLNTPTNVQLSQGQTGCNTFIYALSGVYPNVLTFAMDYSPYSTLNTNNGFTGSADLCLYLGGTVTGGGVVIYAQGQF